MFMAKATPKAEPLLPIQAAPVAATTDIDAALDAAKQGTITEGQLQAGSRAILAGWKARRGFHTRVYGAIQLDRPSLH